MGTELKRHYDVFLCFRGADTRYNFTGNLYNALCRRRIRTFMYDGSGLKSGDNITATILKTMYEARIFIVVFSSHFVSSTWCLRELEQITEYWKRDNRLLVPIYYNVHPSDVGHLEGKFGEDMANHENTFGGKSVEVLRWRSALREICKLSGYDFHAFKYEYELIERVVRDVTNYLPRYDVYLSFSEEDTGYSFTGFLYDALHRAGFKTIKKGKGFEKEDQITAIGKSRLSIVVLSKNYAYSSSCLDELVIILDPVKEQNQLIWPIFYQVEPSDVRHQRNNYHKAMTKHEKKFGKNSAKVQKWRSALFEVANLKGWHLKTRYEYEVIKQIVDAAIKFCSLE